MNTPLPVENNYLHLDLIDDFFLFLETNNYSPETIYSYKKDLLCLDNFLRSRNIYIKDMDKRLIFEFKAYLVSANRETATNHQKSLVRLSSASVNRCLSAVRAYINFLIDQDYHTPVVPNQFKMVKKEKPHPNVAELNELISLIESPSILEKDPIISSRNRAMLEVLFSTGMRISELLNLNKRDIDSSGRIFITGKGRKQRFVYMTDRAQFYLEQYLALRNDTQQALFVPTKGRNIAKAQRRISTNYLQEKIKRYREKLKINLPTSAHSLRHGFATYMAEEGASPSALQILLGHESLNTTTRYVNASDRFAQETHRKYHPLARKSK
ncbi:tyrosine-type recombinase/integrase [Candidatus Daviesbacteria bacterium]|nr:tyrosine-type recombinase/integrase [Candidatus Daviesbacteria bacterium]